MKNNKTSKITLADLASRRAYYKEHPVEFIEEMIGVKVAYHQKKMINAIVKHDNVTVASSNGIGKSFIFSALAVWFFYTHLENDDKPTIVIFTAPSFLQCRENVYNNILAHIDRLERNIEKMTGCKTSFFGNISKNQNLAEIRYGRRNYMMGVSTEGANKNVGKHGSYVLCIFDEAQGIAEEKFSDFNGITLSGDVIKQVMIGNTTLPFGNSGRFYNSFKPNSGWYPITIPCFDTDNFINPNIKLEDYTREESDPLYWRNKLDKYCGTDYYKAKKNDNISQWNRDVKKALGEFGGHLINPVTVYDILVRNDGSIDSYEFLTRCRAEFPKGDENGVFPQVWIEKAMSNYHNDNYWQTGEVVMGVDVAQGRGNDKSAIAVRNGNKIVFADTFNLELFDLIEQIKEIYNKFEVQKIYVETDAVGRDKFLILEKIGLPVFGIQTGGGVGQQNSDFVFNKELQEQRKKDFSRKRDEVWWHLRELLNPLRPQIPETQGKLPLLLPDKTQLRQELSNITYTRNENGKIKIISKEDLKNKIGRSSDLADSIVFACAEMDDNFYMPCAFGAINISGNRE